MGDKTGQEPVSIPDTIRLDPDAPPTPLPIHRLRFAHSVQSQR
jgi:hypothetical protein